MRDRARQAHFGEEPLAGNRIAFERRRQELQRDRLAEPEVVGPVHLAHAAAPHARNDAVPLSEECAGDKCAGA